MSFSWDYPSTEREEPKGPPPIVNMPTFRPSPQQQQQRPLIPTPRQMMLPPPGLVTLTPSPFVANMQFRQPGGGGGGGPSVARPWRPGGPIMPIIVPAPVHFGLTATPASVPYRGSLFPSAGAAVGARVSVPAPVSKPIYTTSSRQQQQQAPAYVHVPEGSATVTDDEDGKKERPEELFPPGKVAEVEPFLRQSNEIVIGLEYLIEIQHNTIKKMQPSYCCLLCDWQIRTKNDNMSTLDLARGHIRSNAHKLKYLSKYFPVTKEKKLDVKKPVDTNDLNHLVGQIMVKFGPMKVKIVVGQKLFKKKMGDIKTMVENSSHFKEDHSFLESVLDKVRPESLPKSRIDVYADAFEEFEREERRRSTSRSARQTSSKPFANRSSLSPFSSKQRGLSPVRDGLSPKRKRHSRSPRRSPSRDRSSRRRSRSKDRSSKKKHKRSSRSRSKSREKRKRHRSGSKERSSKWSRKEERIISFLEKEREMVLGLEENKQRLMKNSEKHPDYEKEWAKFYAKKCEEYGGANVQLDYINDEWVEFWKDYFFRKHDSTVREECNKLMNKERVFRKDLADFEQDHPGYMKEKYARSPLPGAQSKADDVAAPPSSSSSRLSAEKSSRGTAAAATAVNDDPIELSPTPPAPSQQQQQQQQQQPPRIERGSSLNLTKDDVTVIGTLRFLSALESILLDMGPSINASLGKANSLEVNVGYGTSMGMINDPDFFRLLDAAKERLLNRMEMGAVSDRQSEVSRICIDNITILMQQSTCEKEEIVLISHNKQRAPTATKTEIDPTELSVKAAIAKILAEQMMKQGKVASPEELASIVNAEYERVKHRMEQTQIQPQMQQQPQQQATHFPRDPRASSSFQAPTGYGRAPAAGTALGGDGRGATNNLDMVNWGALQNAVRSSNSSRLETGPSWGGVAAAAGSSSKSAGNAYDDLTVEELASLFKNFKELDRENKEHLIEYMKKLEKSNPAKVRELKQHIHGSTTA